MRINAAGELNNPAVVISNGVTFNFIEEPYKSNGIETYGSYLQLTGGRIFCAGYKGLLICTINSIYSNIEVLYSMDSGLQLRNGGNIIKNCDSHDNFDYRLIRNGVIKFGFSSDGISDKLHGNVPNTFIGCRSWNNGDDGFDFFSRWTSDFTVL